MQILPYEIRVKSIAYHRNGIGGAGFHAVLFDYSESRQVHSMIAMVFEDRGYCAVLDADKVAKGDVEFGSNSWRGDNFEDALRSIIKDRGVK